jgi:hypothetical protein
VTVSGTDNDGRSPDSTNDIATVGATLSNGVATGNLRTAGKVRPFQLDSQFAVFEGSVTCMDVDGKRVVIGAFGTASLHGDGGGPLPGTYTQVLTLEFGNFPLSHTGPPQRFANNSFGLLGEHDEGVPSETPPNCNRRHLSDQHVFAGELLEQDPYRGLPFYRDGEEFRLIHISPSITSPKDGHISQRGIVRLSGTGEPNRAITVYEVGHQASGTEVVANEKGKWSLTLSGVAAGTHVFTASAVNGSPIPANTVEVNVVR